jgi:hypothetical protein
MKLTPAVVLLTLDVGGARECRFLSGASSCADPRSPPQEGFRTILGTSSFEAFVEAEGITERVRIWQAWVYSEPLDRWTRTVVQGCKHSRSPRGR